MSTREWNIQNYLNTEEEVVEFLKVSLEEDTPSEFLNSMAIILKSKGYAKVAEKMGVSREGLYNSFNGKTKPKFETIYNAIDSLGFRFDIVPKSLKV